MLVAEGGEYLDSKGRPAFNSDAGVRALQWFVDLYKAKAVPPGTPNYLWDDLGQGFASGTVALDLDWPSWARLLQRPRRNRKWPAMSASSFSPPDRRENTRGWSGTHGLLGDRGLQEQGRRRVAHPLADQRRQPEDRSRPRRAANPYRSLAMGHRAGGQRPLKKEVLTAFQEASKYAFPVPPNRRMDRDLERRLS